MITNFKYYLITENPDILYTDNEKYYVNDDSIPFFAGVKDDKVVSVYVGDRGSNHSDSKVKMSKDEHEAYPGRLWLSGKIMSFWVYPNEKDFRTIINGLEKLLNIKIFKNGWQIEIVEKGGEIQKKDSGADYYYSDYNNSDYNDIISLDYYTGSNDVPEEVRLRHLMNWKEKESMYKSGKISRGKFGSSMVAFDQPRNIKYRHALYQEKNIYNYS
jgi:hypothetical protein